MKKLVLVVVALLCGCYAIAQVGGLVLMGLHTSASQCVWDTADVTVINGVGVCGLNVGTTAAPLPGLAIAVNQGPFVQVYPPTTQASGVTSFATRTGVVVPAANDYSFSQVGGQITASQLPPTLTCSVSATIGSANKVTLTGCL